MVRARPGKGACCLQIPRCGCKQMEATAQFVCLLACGVVWCGGSISPIGKFHGQELQEIEIDRVHARQC